MSAFRFYLDSDGYVRNGYADTHSRSDETWRLTGFPPRPLEECGVDIVWQGVPFEHIATVNGIDYVNGAPVWAADTITRQEAA